MTLLARQSPYDRENMVNTAENDNELPHRPCGSVRPIAALNPPYGLGLYDQMEPVRAKDRYSNDNTCFGEGTHQWQFERPTSIAGSARSPGQHPYFSHHQQRQLSSHAPQSHTPWMSVNTFQAFSDMSNLGYDLFAEEIDDLGSLQRYKNQAYLILDQDGSTVLSPGQDDAWSQHDCIARNPIAAWQNPMSSPSVSKVEAQENCPSFSTNNIRSSDMLLLRSAYSTPENNPLLARASSLPEQICFGLQDSSQVGSPSSTTPTKQPRARVRSISREGDPNKGHTCPACKKSFERRSNLTAHYKTHGRRPRVTCPVAGCDKTFTRRVDCERHHNGVSVTCETRQELWLIPPKGTSRSAILL